MKTRDTFQLAATALLKHGKRTGLSLVGMAIGVAAVLLLTALGEGARAFVLGQFETLGSHLLVVLPGKAETTGAVPGFVAGVPNDLTLADAEALRRGIPAARHAAPVALGNETVAAGDRSRQVLVAGSTSEMLAIRDLEVRSGRFLPEMPWDRGAPVAVLGSKLATELFPGQDPIGETVRIGGWRTRVIGVLQPQGVHLGIDMDEWVLLPVASAMRMFNRSSLFRIILRLAPQADVESAKRRCLEILTARHGEEDVTLVTQDSVIDALSSILRMLTLALAGIAAISLSVAGIGIMNVMLVSVSERVPEVGLLKAVGAAPGQIMRLFLVEAVLISTAGGLLGVGLGWALVQLLVAFYPVFPASAPPWAAAAALAVAVVFGAVFGVLPARRAMRLDPVTALARR
ncbi:MAG: ABC transporter permease [Planctomycetota bacterium]